MLSYRNLQSLAGASRLGAGQGGTIARSAVVTRLVVACSTKLRSRAEADDEEAVYSVSSGLQLKPRRARAALSPQSPPDSTAAYDRGGLSGHGTADEPYGADVAALRDATSTASTSGNGRSTSLASKQHKFSVRAAAAAAAAPRSADLNLPVSTTKKEESTISGSESILPLQTQARSKQQQRPAISAPPAHPLPAGVTQERDLEIHNELRGCEDWRDVLDVVADEAECLSVRTAVQALTRLNTLTRGSVAVRRELLEHSAFQTLKEVLYSQVSLMNNVQLSNSLYALAQLQVVLPALLLKGYAAAAAARAETFYPRDIATLLAAAAALRWSPPRELLDAMGFRAMGLLSTHEFDPRSIPTLLHSIALLGYKNPLLAEVAAQRLAAPGVMASLVPQGVANSLWALGRMETYHPPAVEAALAAFSSAPLSYKPQEVANLLWSLTAFRHNPEGTFITFARSLLHRPDGQLRAADLATLMYTMALFNVAPGTRVLERVEAISMRLLEAAAEKSKEAAAAAAAAAEADPTEEGRGKTVAVHRGAISAVELAHMYWGLALLGVVESPLFGLLEEELAAVWEREGAEIPESLLRVAFQGWLASKLELPRRSHSFPPLALDALKRAWTGRLIEESSRMGRGRTVDEVAAILDTLKVTYDKRRPTGDGLAVIDIALRAGSERYVALQVVHAVDRCANNKQLLGPVGLLSRLMERNGWEVRYLRAADLDSLTPDMRVRFVEELLRAMGVAVRKSSGEASSQSMAVSSGTAGRDFEMKAGPARAVTRGRMAAAQQNPRARARR